MEVEEDPSATVDSCDMMDIRDQLNAAIKIDHGSFKGQVWSAYVWSWFLLV